MTARRGISIQTDWVAVSRVYDDRAARNYALPTDLRLSAIARSRLEFEGHAHFGRQELRMILSKVNTATGNITRLSADALTKAIARLVDAGVLMDGSWSQCLRLPLFEVQTGVKGVASPCPSKPGGGAPPRLVALPGGVAA